MTLPEIDKLITLSRLFGVSVGWLLGEERRENALEETAGEETSGEETESVPPPEELSEEQLRMVEEIVGRYLAAQPRPLSTRQRRGWGWPPCWWCCASRRGFLTSLARLRG